MIQQKRNIKLRMDFLVLVGVVVYAFRFRLVFLTSSRPSCWNPCLLGARVRVETAHARYDSRTNVGGQLCACAEITFLGRSLKRETRKP